MNNKWFLTSVNFVLCHLSWMQLKIVTSGNIYSLQPQYVLQTLYLQTKIESPSTRCGILDKKRLSFKIIALQIQRMIKLLNISKSLPRQTLHNTVFGCVHVFFFFFKEKRETGDRIFPHVCLCLCVVQTATETQSNTAERNQRLFRGLPLRPGHRDVVLSFPFLTGSN